VSPEGRGLSAGKDFGKKKHPGRLKWQILYLNLKEKMMGGRIN